MTASMSRRVRTLRKVSTSYPLSASATDTASHTPASLQRFNLRWIVYHCLIRAEFRAKVFPSVVARVCH